MASDAPAKPTPPAPLALRPRDAARALGIGERTLWALTAPRGPIPVVRVGACRLYPVDALRAWLESESRPEATP